MLIRVFIVCILVSYTVVNLQAQSNWIEWKEDVSEAEEMSGWQEQYEFLSELAEHCLLYTSPSPRDLSTSRMPSSA